MPPGLLTKTLIFRRHNKHRKSPQVFLKTSVLTPQKPQKASARLLKTPDFNTKKIAATEHQITERNLINEHPVWHQRNTVDISVLRSPWYHLVLCLIIIKCPDVMRRWVQMSAVDVSALNLQTSWLYVCPSLFDLIFVTFKERQEKRGTESDTAFKRQTFPLRAAAAH